MCVDPAISKYHSTSKISRVKWEIILSNILINIMKTWPKIMKDCIRIRSKISKWWKWCNQTLWFLNWTSTNWISSQIWMDSSIRRDCQENPTVRTATCARRQFSRVTDSTWILSPRNTFNSNNTSIRKWCLSWNFNKSGSAGRKTKKTKASKSTNSTPC